MLIDRFLPEYDWNEVHSIEIGAAPAAVLAAVRAVTAGEIRLLGSLLWLRALPARLLGHRPPVRGGGPVLEEVLRSTFVVLAQNESEMVVGTIGRFWQIRATHAGFRDGDAFIAFETPGWAKAALNFSVSDAGRGRTRLATETRIAATGAGARRRFAAYWLIVRPGSGLIRVMWLRAVKKSAEKAAPPVI
jgi:hypothetical protein